MESLLSHPLWRPLFLSLVLIAAVPLAALYFSLVERKVLADLQVRLGPMCVGPPTACSSLSPMPSSCY
jgi:NADH-quinone oxidoreductase subunit H